MGFLDIFGSVGLQKHRAPQSERNQPLKFTRAKNMGT